MDCEWTHTGRLREEYYVPHFGPEVERLALANSDFEILLILL